MKSKLEIIKLPWDSDFFGLEVGILTISGVSSNKGLDALLTNSQFDVIYIFSKHEELKYWDARLMDVKMIFVKNLTPSLIEERIEPSIIEFEISQHNYTDLLELAYLSGSLSRFKLDTRFPKGSFEKLYEAWLQKSIDGNNSMVLIELAQNTIVGFITLDFLNKEWAVIGLIAVLPEYQGRGVAKRLINRAQHISFQKGLKNLRVATQKRNQGAMKLYSSCGFNIDEETYVYHYWT